MPVLSVPQRLEVEAHSRAFWERELPRAIRHASDTPDGLRISVRVLSKAFGRPERGSARDVLSWIACVERESQRQDELRRSH